MLLEKATEIVRNAGKILTDKLQSGFSVEQKGTIDLVTDADRAAEEYIIQQLTEHFPKYSVLAEEQGLVDAANEEGLWVVDPLDGTTNFAHGFPYFSVSVALMREGDIQLGLVYDPVSDELFSATKGNGAFLNGRKIHISSSKTLQTSLLVTGFSYDVATSSDDNMYEFEKVTKASQGVARVGSAALDLCNVACGRFDGYWETKINAWDIAAGSLIVIEAGGKVTLCSGEPFDPFAREVVATNGLIHDELIGILTSNPRNI